MQILRALNQLFSGLTLSQRKILMLCAIALVALAGAMFGFTSRPQAGGTAASAARSPLSIFASRSPGARADGALFRTKRRLAAAPRSRPRPAVVIPRERVLSPVRIRPGGPLQIAPGAPNVAPQGLSLDAVPLPTSVPGPAFRSPYIPDVGSGYLPFPPGGPVIGAPPVEGGNPVPPPPAVPEPATWMLLILGLGFVGAALRRQTRLPAGA
ncbi:PEPxxWA-CTERM sorting domain-containing protein [Novosphingobium sp. RD2P27]|uniref:PEPxxWA-CTERM sorting domain-containing protein n=1 Tax=Novosphingobium kalidii TaxID=3230299 RepID=A0ABV2D158_9SPHN